MKSIHSLSFLPALALLACGCGLLGSSESAKMEEESDGVYRVTIPAQMYELPITFKASDRIYLYNETQDAFACDKNGAPTVLYPEEISEDGTECVLQGQVSFYKYSYETERRTLLKVGGDDSYCLVYNLSEVDTEDPVASVFDYNGQDGSAASALAHFYAESLSLKMNAPGNPARFCGAQTMLDLNPYFMRDGAMVTPTLSRLVVSAGDALAGTLHALSGEVRPDRLTIKNPSATEFFLSLAFDPESDCDQIVFQAQDTEGNFYDAAMDFPEYGFLAGAIYNGMPLFEYSMSLQAPDVSRSDGGAVGELTPNAENTYEISPKSGKIAIRIDGDCVGYNFVLKGKSTVTLAGGGTAYYPFEGCFITSLFSDLNVVLDSDYTIRCTDWHTAIMADGASLKLSTTGGTFKLTVTYEADEFFDQKGMKGQNYSAFSSQEAADLAAGGFSVTLSEEKDNGDGTRTCVYIVAPKN